MRILPYLLLLFSLNLSAQWTPHMSSLNGQVRVISSILQQHPEFFAQNVKYRANPLLTLKPVPYIVSRLGRNAADITFGQVLRMSTEYTDEGEFTYDEHKVELLKNDILSSLENVLTSLDGTNIKNLAEDLARISERGDEVMREYIKLIPFIYNSDGEPLYDGINKTSVDQIAEKIGQSAASDLDNMYNTLFNTQVEKNLSNISENRVLQAINTFKKDFIAGKRNPVLRNALTLLSPSGQVLSRRSASIEELPALIGIFRGNFGRTCATREIPYYPLIKGTKTYLVRKSSDFSSPDAGFAFVAPVEFEGKMIPYIITVNGPSLTNVDTREVIRMIAKAWNTDMLLVSDIMHNPMLINTDNVKKGMIFDGATEVNNIKMPKGWEYIDEDIRNRTPFGGEGIYYDASRLKRAMLVKLDRTSSSTKRYVPTPYKRTNPKSMDITDRAIAAVYCVDGYGRDEQEILEQFNVTAKQLKAAAILTGLNPINPLTAEQFRLLREELGFQFSDLANFDIYTRVNTLTRLYSESPEITTGKGWSSAFTAVNRKLSSMMYEAENSDAQTKLIILKISTPEKYWAEDFADGIKNGTYSNDIILSILITVMLKNADWPLRIWECVPLMLTSDNEYLKKELIGLLSLSKDWSMNTWNTILTWLNSGNEKDIVAALSAIKGQKELPTGVWEAFADILEKGPLTAKTKVIELLEGIEVWHRDFWDSAPSFLTSYEGACVIANKRTWPEHFWKMVPSLMTDQNSVVRWGIVMALDQKEEWPKEVWELIPQLSKDSSPDVVRAANSTLEKRGGLLGLETPKVNTAGTQKPSSLSDMIDKANTPEDIFKIEIIFESNSNDPEIMKLYDKFKAKDKEIRSKQKLETSKADSRSNLLVYTGADNSITDSELADKAIDKMLEDFETNGDIFPKQTLRYTARTDVISFLLENGASTPAELKFFDAFQNLLEITKDSYRLDYPAKTKEFEKFRLELYRLKGLRK